MSTHATATIGGATVTTIAAHRQANDTPVAVTLTLSVPMSLEDIVCALWVMVSAGYDLADLTTAYEVHDLVAGMVLNGEASLLEDARLTIADFTTGTYEHDTVTQLREIVADVYGQAAIPTQQTRRLAVAR